MVMYWMPSLPIPCFLFILLGEKSKQTNGELQTPSKLLHF